RPLARRFSRFITPSCRVLAWEMLWRGAGGARGCRFSGATLAPSMPNKDSEPLSRTGRGNAKQILIRNQQKFTPLLQPLMSEEELDKLFRQRRRGDAPRGLNEEIGKQFPKRQSIHMPLPRADDQEAGGAPR